MTLSRKDQLIHQLMLSNGLKTTFVTHLLNIEKQKQKNKEQNESDEGSEESIDEETFKKNVGNAKTRGRNRVGISEEVFGEFNKKEAIEYRVIPKN